MKNLRSETSLMVQWLRLHASKAGGVGSIPGWGTKILHALWHGHKSTGKKKEKVGIERIFSCEQTESLLSENLSGCVHKEATFMVCITQVWADLLWPTFFLARFLILGIIKLGIKSLLYIRILWPPQSSDTANLQSSYMSRKEILKKKVQGIYLASILGTWCYPCFIGNRFREAACTHTVCI